MPTYDYECKHCGHIFEKFQNMSDPPVRTCPKCGKSVKRLIGGGMGIIFKGSGFYVTDNKKSSSVSDAKSSKPAETKTPEKKETKTDAPAGKKEKLAG